MISDFGFLNNISNLISDIIIKRKKDLRKLFSRVSFLEIKIREMIIFKVKTAEETGKEADDALAQAAKDLELLGMTKKKSVENSNTNTGGDNSNTNTGGPGDKGDKEKGGGSWEEKSSPGSKTPIVSGGRR
jgi:hypothetical protein